MPRKKKDETNSLEKLFSSESKAPTKRRTMKVKDALQKAAPAKGTSMIIETKKTTRPATEEPPEVFDKRKLSKVTIPISKAGICFDETDKGSWICIIRNNDSSVCLEIELPAEEKEILRTGKEITLELKVKGQ